MSEKSSSLIKILVKSDVIRRWFLGNYSTHISSLQSDFKWVSAVLGSKLLTTVGTGPKLVLIKTLRIKGSKKKGFLSNLMRILNSALKI